MIRLFARAGFLSFALVSAAHAGVVAPTVPSGLVTLTSSGAFCTPPNIAMDTRVTSDGAQSSFSIPSGMVLVLTGASWSGAAAPSVMDVAIDSSLVWFGASTSSLGNAAIQDVVVKSGHKICVQGVNIPSFAILHGFLAKDK